MLFIVTYPINYFLIYPVFNANYNNLWSILKFKPGILLF
jgi:hypothetical protein